MSVRDILSERMARPQRHRLLQGFPAVPAMVRAVPEHEGAEEPPPSLHLARGRVVRRIDGGLDDRAATPAREHPGRGRPVEDLSEPALLTVDGTRDLIVGVIPHTQCVPAREACGFCTFPHDSPDVGERRAMVEAVIGDIEAIAGRPPLSGRNVGAIYLGGGTANLCSPEQIALVVQALGSHLEIGDAELTLEGTPQLFASWFCAHLKNLAQQPVGSRRISMGVQTFDPGFLRMMGRQRFGDAALVRRLVKRCRERGITTSGDLLFNLPGQTQVQMHQDVDTALAVGLEQICLYNLVLYEGLGTPWSSEPELVARMPDSARACENWLSLRERLLAAGFVQSTLTNFEREDVAAGPARFQYELASFSVERTDGIGFGPLSLTTFVNWQEKRGLKLLRRKDISGPPWSRGDLMYRYDVDGLRLLYLTRGLAKTRLEEAAYLRLFGTRAQDDFSEALQAASAEGLVNVHDGGLELTPRGMFFADAVVSVLALSLARERGAGLSTRDLLSERPRSGDYVSMG